MIRIRADYIEVNNQRFDITPLASDLINQKESLKWQHSIFDNTIYSQVYLNREVPYQRIIQSHSNEPKSKSFFSFIYSGGRNPFFVFVYKLIKITYISVSLIYLLHFYVKFILKSRIRPRKIESEEVIITFCNTSRSRISSFMFGEHVPHIEADLIRGINRDTILEYCSKNFILKNVYRILRLTLREFNLACKSLNSVCVSNRMDFFIWHYLSKRVGYTILIDTCLDSILENNKVSKIYSGLRDERFAESLNRLCAKYSVDSVCVPHGLAYAYQYPNGLFGNHYIAYNHSEKEFLERTYKNRFKNISILKETVYPQSIDSNEFTYFTTSRDVQADGEVIDFLARFYSEVKVKLHPNDSRANYSNSKIHFVDSLSLALESSTYIVSRASTILLEGISMKKKSLAICFSEHDKFRFALYPAFRNTEILEVRTHNDLIAELGK